MDPFYENLEFDWTSLGPGGDIQLNNGNDIASNMGILQPEPVASGSGLALPDLSSYVTENLQSTMTLHNPYNTWAKLNELQPEPVASGSGLMFQGLPNSATEKPPMLNEFQPEPIASGSGLVFQGLPNYVTDKPPMLNEFQPEPIAPGSGLVFVTDKLQNLPQPSSNELERDCLTLAHSSPAMHLDRGLEVDSNKKIDQNQGLLNCRLILPAHTPTMWSNKEIRYTPKFHDNRLRPLDLTRETREEEIEALDLSIRQVQGLKQVYFPSFKPSTVLDLSFRSNQLGSDGVTVESLQDNLEGTDEQTKNGNKRKLLSRSAKERANLNLESDRAVRRKSKKQKKPRNVKCNVCNRTFPYPRILACHLKIHDGPPDKVLNCAICSISYSKMDQLTKHLKRAHNVCRFCERVFDNPEVLEEHFKTHSGPKRFLCVVCNKLFRYKPQLLKHKDVCIG